MEGKTYWTIVKGKHPVFGGNDYVRGVIMGIMSTTCQDDFIGPVWWDEKTGDHIMQVKTTQPLYQLFAGRVEKKYPGLCEFDVDMSTRVVE